MQILIALHRLAETGAGRVKTLKGQSGEMRLRVGDFRVRFTEESARPREPIKMWRARESFIPCGPQSEGSLPLMAGGAELPVAGYRSSSVCSEASPRSAKESRSS